MWVNREGPISKGQGECLQGFDREQRVRVWLVKKVRGGMAHRRDVSELGDKNGTVQEVRVLLVPRVLSEGSRRQGLKARPCTCLGLAGLTG